MKILYLVATPIGNLEDISTRALRILREVHLVAAEDTRQTRKIFSHYGINTRLTSYYEHNKNTKLETILLELEKGDVALVSEAGTPGLNDPGYELVRAALDAGYVVSPIPGPCAPIASLVASGLPTDAFLYLGYLPRKANDRRRRISEFALFPHTMVYLETPHRLLAALEDLYHILGDREVAVARELTKIHEEIFRGTLCSAHQHFTSQQPRGEITLVVAGCPNQVERWPEEKIKIATRQLLSQGKTPASIASQLASEAGWRRREVYRLCIEIQGK